MNLSIIIPYKAGVLSREKNYEYVLNRFKKMYPKAEICIGEDTINSSKGFCRSSAINNGVKKSTNDILIISDCDIVIPKETLDYSLDLIDDEEFLIPFGICYDLSKERTEKILAKDPKCWLGIERDIAGVRDIRANRLAGGIQLITKDLFNKIGGYDTRFQGWGWEDTVFCWKIHQELGEYTVVDDADIFHLWHDRAELSWDNYDLAQRIKKKFRKG